MAGRYPGAAWRPVAGRGGLSLSGNGRRLVLHTTETPPGWNPTYPYPPHLTIDAVPDTLKVYQHVDFDKGAYALKSTTSACGYSANSRGEVVIQVEMIGYARDVPNYSARWYRRIAEMCTWMCDTFDIPKHFPFDFDGSSAYGTNGSARRSCTTWLNASGIVGHQHCPAPNDHWDPGQLSVAALASYMTAPKEDEMETPIPRPSWFGAPVLQRLKAMGIEPMTKETMTMWRMLAFIDRAYSAGLGSVGIGYGSTVKIVKP